MNNFSTILKHLMEEKEISAYKLSKETGIPQPVIGRWKRGEQSPSSENLRKIADYFCVSSDYLLSRENPTISEDNTEYSKSHKFIIIENEGAIMKKSVSDEEWIKYNKILQATMPELFNK